MRRSHLLASSFCTLSLLACGSSFGQAGPQCKPVEFAELQTFSKDELQEEFCKNRIAGAFWSKQSADSLALATQLVGNPESKRLKAMSDEQQTYWFACMDQNRRLMRLLEKQGGVPKCE